MDETLVCDHLHESYWAVLSLCYTALPKRFGGETLQFCGSVWTKRNAMIWFWINLPKHIFTRLKKDVRSQTTVMNMAAFEWLCAINWLAHPYSGKFHIYVRIATSNAIKMFFSLKPDFRVWLETFIKTIEIDDIADALRPQSQKMSAAGWRPS